VRTRLTFTLLFLTLGVVLAACGSSAAPGVVTAPSAGATGTTVAATPKPPPALAKEPTVTVPSTPAPTKLVSKDLVTGTGQVAKAGDTVVVNYVGALYKTGKTFDSSWQRNTPFTAPLTSGSVIPGWVAGVPGMRVGGRRELIIPPSLGYGAKGSPPTIPANATLIFIIDLLKINS
jgi:peptidylprolyl isomerase